MHASVPQFVDIEDKIAFGLTGKQLLWMGGAGGVLLLTYSLLEREAFYVAGIFILALFGALAFWKPQGLSLFSFAGFVITFFTKPRSYIWKRIATTQRTDIHKAQEVQKSKMDPLHQEKNLPTGSQLKKIAWKLDTAGRINNQ